MNPTPDDPYDILESDAYSDDEKAAAARLLEAFEDLERQTKPPCKP